MFDHVKRYATEALLGAIIAALIVWIAAVTVDSVPFVYQGY